MLAADTLASYGSLAQIRDMKRFDVSLDEASFNSILDWPSLGIIQ